MSDLIVRVWEDKRAAGKAAAEQAAATIRAAIADRGCARIVAATGASQFEFLEALVNAPAMNWQKVELFHLDEYVGVPMRHPASFSRYLQERLIARTGITRHHLMNGAEAVEDVIGRMSEAIRSADVDLAFVGIGENAHLAFNDPPADFETDDPYILVSLDEACRRQQVHEGWFSKIEDVPTKAISMSVRQILKAREIVAVVPDRRKAEAVRKCFEELMSPMAPASILQTHLNATIYLDRDSASLLSPETLARYAARPEPDAATTRALAG